MHNQYKLWVARGVSRIPALDLCSALERSSARECWQLMRDTGNKALADGCDSLIGHVQMVPRRWNKKAPQGAFLLNRILHVFSYRSLIVVATLQRIESGEIEVNQVLVLLAAQLRH